MPAELRCVPASLRSHARCAGLGESRAQACAEQLVEEGVDALLSMGVAGALDVRLGVGDLVQPQAVVDTSSGERFAVCAFPGVKACETLLSTPKPVLTGEQKKQLAVCFSAHAVDMESVAIARVAVKHQLPFYCLRTISDSAEVDLPADLAGIIGGQVKINKLTLAIVKRPLLLTQLLRLAWDYRLALKSLRNAANNFLFTC